MFWDIALPVLAAVAQGLTGFLGWRVTVDGVQEDRKRVYEWLFVIASIVGVVSVGIAAYRGTQISRDLTDLKNGQQTTITGIQRIEKTPPNVSVNVPPSAFTIPPASQHTHVEYTPVMEATRLLGLPQLTLHAGDTPTIPLAFRNAGAFAVQKPEDSGLLTLVPSKKSTSAFRTLRKTFVKSGGPSGALPAGSQNGAFHTAVGPKLSADDIGKINSGELYLCGFGAVKWLDDTGQYETHFAQCLQSEPDQRSANWHLLKENNEEKKLH